MIKNITCIGRTYIPLDLIDYFMLLLKIKVFSFAIEEGMTV